MLSNQIQIFQYNGSPITFNTGDSVMVNATEMARPFGKATKDWLRTKSAEEFINSLSTVRQIRPTELVKIFQGGNGIQGTWMHEDVALEFARWLHPGFAIWCNDRIKELLTTGVATVNDDDATIAHAMEILNKRLEQAKAEKELLEQQNHLQNEQLQLAAPKVRYHDEVLTSVSTYTATQIAKEFGMSAETFNRRLHEKGVQYKQNGQWLLYSKHQDKGYTKTITRTYTGSTGKTHTSQLTVWTETGRQFLHTLFS